MRVQSMIVVVSYKDLLYRVTYFEGQITEVAQVVPSMSFFNGTYFKAIEGWKLLHYSLRLSAIAAKNTFERFFSIVDSLSKVRADIAIRALTISYKTVEDRELSFGEYFAHTVDLKELTERVNSFIEKNKKGSKR